MSRRIDLSAKVTSGKSDESNAQWLAKAIKHSAFDRCGTVHGRRPIHVCRATGFDYPMDRRSG